MEVIDNGNQIKDTENQTPSSNYTCRLSRDLNIGSSSVVRNKGENDVRLLVACKAQLSSEVIRWKAESLRLQKERDSARIRMKELDHVVGKFSERAKELETRLSVAEEENKRLRSRIHGSPNISVMQKLSTSLDKYHSYPWSESVSVPSTSSDLYQNVGKMEGSPVSQEDWKEVSQKLLEKMKQEMKELQELGSNFSLQENDAGDINSVEKEQPDIKISDDMLEDSLSSLITETESLKHCLLEQRRNLKALMAKITLGNIHHCAEESSKDGSRGFKISHTNTNSPTRSVKPKLPVRHSDDSFRAFFTKHLEGCQNIDKMSKTMQLFMQSDSSNVSQATKSPKTSSNSEHPQSEADKHASDKKTVEDERICPICQAPFDQSIPQDKFEEHVLDHLEEESASLLDQYVVV